MGRTQALADRIEAAKQPQTLREFGKLLGAIAACEAAGAVGALGTGDAADYYGKLDKPEWSPPSGVFAPVWTALYALMGVSLYLLWRAAERGQDTRRAMRFFALHLILNALWSFLFFRWRSPGAALVDIVALWVAIVLTMRAASRVSKWAALLLLPYLLWVGFATVLNASIWRRNAD